MRLSASKALSHQWIQIINYENIGIDNDINRTANDSLKRFSDIKNMKMYKFGSVNLGEGKVVKSKFTKHKRNNTVANNASSFMIKPIDPKDISQDEFLDYNNESKDQIEITMNPKKAL